MRVLSRSTAASVAALALVATACGAGGAATPTTAEGAKAALMSESTTTSITTITFDGAFDINEVAALASAMGEDADPNDPEAAKAAQYFSTFIKNFSMQMISGADQTGAFSLRWANDPVIDVRVDGSKAPVFTTTEEALAADPYEMGMYARVDLDALKSAIATFDEQAAADMDAALGYFDPSSFPGDLGALGAAALAGDWVGVDGLVDPSTMQDFNSAAGYGDMSTMSREAALDLFFGPVTLSTPVGNTSTISINAGELWDGLKDSPAGAAMQADPMLSSMDFDLDLVDVGTVTFSGEHVTEFRLNLVEAILQGFEQLDGGANATLARSVVDGWNTSHLDMVVTITDHGKVGNVAGDVKNPTTMQWSDLMGMMTGMMSGMLGA